MLNIKSLSIFAFFLTSSSLWAGSPICEQKNLIPTTCTELQLKSGPSILGSLSSIETLVWLESEIRIHQEIYRQKKELFANMFRFLQNGESQDKNLQPMVIREISDTENDFQTLFQVSKNAAIIEARLQICYTKGLCSTTRRIEIEDQLALVQNSKTLLLIKRPLLSHKNFEDFIKKQVPTFIDDDKVPAASIIKDLIKETSRQTALSLVDKVDGINHYLNDPQAPVINEKNAQYSKKYPEQITSRHPGVVDDLLDRFEMISPPADKQALLCSFATKRQKDRDRDALVKTGIETSLFIAPFLLGPWGRVGATGLEGVLGSKLLQFGLTAKEIQGGAWVARAAVAISTNSFQSMEVSKLGKECAAIEQKYYINADLKNFQTMSKCRSEYQDSMFIASLGWAMSIAPEIPGPLAKFYKAKFTPQMIEEKIISSQIGNSLQKNALSKNQWAKEFHTPDQGTFTYMDLSKIERVSDQHMKSLPDDYWKFVGNVYSDRLNLTPEEIKGFIKSSQDFAPRTKLIVNTTKSVKETDQFQGGVGVVISDKSKDQLPFEKALGKTMDRKSGEKSAEIVRLTVSKDADAEKISKSLINQAAGLILQDPDIKTVYVYTSRIHQRLYNKLGVKATNVVKAGDRDVVITLRREDIETLLANTKH